MLQKYIILFVLYCSPSTQTYQKLNAPCFQSWEPVLKGFWDLPPCFAVGVGRKACCCTSCTRWSGYRAAFVPIMKAKSRSNKLAMLIPATQSNLCTLAQFYWYRPALQFCNSSEHWITHRAASIALEVPCSSRSYWVFATWVQIWRVDEPSSLQVLDSGYIGKPYY